MLKSKYTGIMRVVLIIVLCIAGLLGTEYSASAASSVRISGISGSVSAVRKGSKAVDAYPGMSLNQGDTITTGAGASTNISVDNDKEFVLYENSKVTISLTGSSTGLKLEYGNISNNIKKTIPNGTSYTVNTSSTVMGIRSTIFLVEYYYELDGDGDLIYKVRCTTLEGKVVMDASVDRLGDIVKQQTELATLQSGLNPMDALITSETVKLEDLPKESLELIVSNDERFPNEIVEKAKELLPDAKPMQPPTGGDSEEVKSNPYQGGGSGGGSGSRGYSLTVAVASGHESLGTAEIATGQETTNNAGALVSVTAVATASGYNFYAWTDASGNVISKVDTYSFNIYANTTLFAQFKQVVSVNIGISNGGTAGVVTLDPPTGPYFEGTRLEMDASRGNVGWGFVGWYDNAAGTGTPLSAGFDYTIPSLSGNVQVYAVYDTAYDIDTQPPTNGQVSVNPPVTSLSGKYFTGQTVTLTATPDTGYRFVYWEVAEAPQRSFAPRLSAIGDPYSTVNPLPLVVGGLENDVHLTPIFEEIPPVGMFSLNLLVSPAATGNVAQLLKIDGAAATASTQHADGTTLQLTASAAAPYIFDGWSVGGSIVSTSSTYTHQMTANTAITAVYSLPQYALTLSTTGGVGTVADYITIELNNSGSSVAASASAKYDHGTSIKLTALSAAPYVFDGWSVGGSIVSASSTYTHTMTANTAITAVYSLPQYALTLSTGGVGSVADYITIELNDSDSPVAASASANYDHGTSIKLTARESFVYNSDMYEFKGWYVNGGSQSASTNLQYTFSFTAATTVHAMYDAVQYDLTFGVLPAGLCEVGDVLFYDEDGNWVTPTATTSSYGESVTVCAWEWYTTTDSVEYEFDKWVVNGTEVNGIENNLMERWELTLNITEDTQIQVRYKKKVFNLSIGAIIEDDAGSIADVFTPPVGLNAVLEQGVYNAEVESGTAVALTADADYTSGGVAYYFAGWFEHPDEPGVEMTRLHNFVMNDDLSLILKYNAQRYALNLNLGGFGSTVNAADVITIDGSAADDINFVREGETVRLSAAAVHTVDNIPYDFAGWYEWIESDTEYVLTSKAREDDFTVSENVTYMAVYEIRKVTLTLSMSPNDGSFTPENYIYVDGVNPDSDSMQYDYGTTVTLQFTENSIMINETVADEPRATITYYADHFNINNGELLLEEIGASQSLRIEDDTSVKAVFLRTYELEVITSFMLSQDPSVTIEDIISIDINNNGDPSPCIRQQGLRDGTPVTLIAQESVVGGDGVTYLFVAWWSSEEVLLSDELTYSFTLTDDAFAYAQYARAPHALSLSVSLDNGDTNYDGEFSEWMYKVELADQLVPLADGTEFEHGSVIYVAVPLLAALTVYGSPTNCSHVNWSINGMQPNGQKMSQDSDYAYYELEITDSLYVKAMYGTPMP